MIAIVIGNIKERNQRMKVRGDGICETLGQANTKEMENKGPRRHAMAGEMRKLKGSKEVEVRQVLGKSFPRQRTPRLQKVFPSDCDRN